jgi:nitrogen fixation protein FixH
MKINWGQAILIFFVFYISLLVFAVFKSRTIDHSLVVKNYYDHDIAYQQRFDEVTNRKLLKDDLKITEELAQKTISLFFGPDANKITGEATFYRPSDPRDDISFEFKVDGPEAFKISTEKLKSGRWIVKVNWKDGLRSYYKEQDIYIQHS